MVTRRLLTLADIIFYVLTGTMVVGDGIEDGVSVINFLLTSTTLLYLSVGVSCDITSIKEGKNEGGRTYI